MMFRVLVSLVAVAAAQEGSAAMTSVSDQGQGLRGEQRQERQERPERPERQERQERQEAREEADSYDCGAPEICFSKEGAKCFTQHPAMFCLNAVKVCMKYIIAGCRDSRIAQVKAAKHVELLEAPETFEQPVSLLFLAAFLPASLAAVGLLAGPDYPGAALRKLRASGPSGRHVGQGDFVSPLLA